jgi:hypothetical protein
MGEAMLTRRWSLGLPAVEEEADVVVWCSSASTDDEGSAELEDTLVEPPELLLLELLLELPPLLLDEVVVPNLLVLSLRAMR